MFRDVFERVSRRHPLQYGYRGRDIVCDPGDDPTVGERYNRCPNCEQWSPCDIRGLLDAVTSTELLLQEALSIDGAQHKQWYLWRIANSLGIEITGIEDKGIAP